MSTQAADAAWLSPRQREAICALRRAYLHNLGVLAARRRRLTAALQVRPGLVTHAAKIQLQRWLSHSVVPA